MSPHDPCVWNTVVMKSQLTSLFHIDDLMLSHGRSQVVTSCVKSLDAACSKNDTLTIAGGKFHEHLGVTLYFRSKGRLIFTQCDVVKKFWMSLPEVQINSIPRKSLQSRHV